MTRPGLLAALAVLLTAGLVEAGSQGGMVQGYVRVPAPTAPALPAPADGGAVAAAATSAAAAGVPRAGAEPLAEVSFLLTRWRARIAGYPCV